MRQSGVTGALGDGAIGWTTPSTATGLPYTVVSSFGCPDDTIQNLYSILIANQTWQATSESWQTLVTTQIPVESDPLAYANGIQAADVSARVTAIGVSHNSATGR